MVFVDTMLPCEFCEELFPEEDLILHQVRDFILLAALPLSRLTLDA